MEIVRLKGFVGTTLLVVGAFLVGGALHGAFVEQSVPATAPATLLPILLGILFIVIGNRLYIPATEYVKTPSSDKDPDGEQSADTELSPLGEKEFEKLESEQNDQNK